jgi:hypothetical protein
MITFLLTRLAFQVLTTSGAKADQCRSKVASKHVQGGFLEVELFSVENE